MSLRQRPRERPQRGRGLVWLGGAALVLVAAVTASAAFIVLSEDAQAPGAGPTPAVSALPTLQRDVALRSGPGPEVAIVARLPAGTELQLVGRTQDGQWLVVAPADRGQLFGWVPADAVSGGDATRLPVVASGAPSAKVPGAASPAPGTASDLPDLVVDNVFSRDNRLVVVVRNVGRGDVTAPLVVRVNDGRPQPLGAKEGEPLRAGVKVEFVLAREYVQRRAVARVTVATDPPTREETLANNTLEVVVTPDRRNDLEIAGAVVLAADGHLQVTVRNNSPIPVVGPVTITVRQTGGASELVARREVVLDLPAGASRLVDFKGTLGIDLTRVVVLLDSEAINDAVPSNNVYPR
ncbi:MAG: hypothetical protein FJZ92_01815 [Chloroflexi bacterium]|nr:hypothetical protein [Chloroflexota bacterium]